MVFLSVLYTLYLQRYSPHSLPLVFFILSPLPSSFPPIAFPPTSLPLESPSILLTLILCGYLPVFPAHAAMLSCSASAATDVLVGSLVFTLQPALAHLCAARLYFSCNRTQYGTQLGGANLWTLKSNWEALFFPEKCHRRMWLLFWVREGQRKLSLSGELRPPFL